MLTFNNAEPIDLNFIRLMGASVKSESAIGYFGTGLKFAIAVLLRTGHEIAITVSGVRYSFTVRQQSLRGKDFQIVYMNDEPLGFTTDLGKNWETWMAFRELYSNMLDEHGWIDGKPGGTSIEVSGPEIEEIYRNRREFFLEGRRCVSRTSEIDFHEGASPYIFYRGVRVHRMNTSAPYTINLQQARLTEDRTLAETYAIGGKVGRGVAACTSPHVIAAFLANTDFESQWDIRYIYADYSAEFKAAVLAALRTGSTSIALRKIMRDLFPQEMIYKELKLSPSQAALLSSSLAFLADRQISIDPACIVLVENLEGATKAAWDKIYGKIILTPSVFRLGEQYLTRVLYEEYLHKSTGMDDETRELQNFLFDEVIRLQYELAKCQTSS